jgi:two-component system OmpR family response regulator
MIVVVDDHEFVLKLIEKFLQKEGMKAELFSQSPKALPFIKEHVDEIQLLILDIFMPEMDGIEFAEEVLKMNEHMNIIMVTAASYDTILYNENLKNRVHFMRKPLNQENFIAYVKKVINKSDNNADQ